MFFNLFSIIKDSFYWLKSRKITLSSKVMKKFLNIDKIKDSQRETQKTDSTSIADNKQQHSILFKSVERLGEKLNIKFVFPFPWISLND